MAERSHELAPAIPSRSYGSGDFSDEKLVTFADVEAAASRLEGNANRTPVMTSRTANKQTGAEIFFKCENFQRTGAFKFRGAYNALSCLPRSVRHRGVLSYSSGNHAQALALAGRLLKVSTTIIMPDDAPEVKLRATRGYGAEVLTYDRVVTTREDLAQRLSKERHLPIIPPYDHPDVVAGQGTACKELIEETGPLDLVMVCCGGGGLLAGSALSARALIPESRVVGVEPEHADDATRSFYTGTLHSIKNPDTIADGARTPFLGRITFPLVLQNVNEMVTVSDAALIRAMHFFWERMKIVVEPTGALAAAALFEGLVDAQGARVGVIISGGNVDLSLAANLFGTLDRPNATI